MKKTTDCFGTKWERNKFCNMCTASSECKEKTLVLKNEKAILDIYFENDEKCCKHFNRGTHLLSRGKVHEAIKEYHKALEYDLDCPDVLNNLACAYTDIKEHKLAYVYAKRCCKAVYDILDAIEAGDLALEPSNWSEDYAIMLSSSGILLMRNKDPEAQKCLELAARLCPKSWLARYNLGVFYYNQGLLEDALREYRMAYRLNSNDHDVVFDLAYCYAQLWMFEEGVKIIEGYLKNHRPTPEMLNFLSTSYLNLNRTEESIKVCEQWLRFEPNSPAPHACLGLGYARAGRVTDAYHEIAIAIKLNEKVHDEVVEGWIKQALEILEDPDDNFRGFLFLIMLMLRRKKLRGHNRC